jgi:HK97 family phage major capsid protein
MTATPDVAKVTADLGAAITRVMSANVLFVNPGWVLPPRIWNYLATLRNSQGALAFPEMAGGVLMGFPFKICTQIPVNLGTGTNESEVYFVNWVDCVIGEALNLMIDVSDTAAYYDGSAVVAPFSQDQTVIRVISEHDFNMRYVYSAAMITGVIWGA